MLELLHLTRNVILSVTGAFPIAAGHHLILCWLSIAVGSCEGKGGEGQWEGEHTMSHSCAYRVQKLAKSATQCTEATHCRGIHTGWHI